MGVGVAGSGLDFGFLSISPPLPPSYAASLGQPGIPAQCHRGCGTGPDLPSRDNGKSDSQIPGQGMVHRGGGRCTWESQGTVGMGHVAEATWKGVGGYHAWVMNLREQVEEHLLHLAGERWQWQAEHLTEGRARPPVCWHLQIGPAHFSAFGCLCLSGGRQAQ